MPLQATLRFFAHSLMVASLMAVSGSGLSVCAQSSGGVSAAGLVRPVATSEEDEGAPLKNDASHQSIKVHGHWKIVVKNADGSVAEAREFENSLTATGANSLAQFLSGNLGFSTTGGLAIDLLTTGTSICGKPNCAMVQSTTGGVGSASCASNQYYCSPTALTTTVSGGSLVLNGQIAATQTGTITSVATILGNCDRSISPYTCLTTSNQVGIAGTFTSTTIASVAVNSGQVVQVSVTISFS